MGVGSVGADQSSSRVSWDEEFGLARQWVAPDAPASYKTVELNLLSQLTLTKSHSGVCCSKVRGRQHVCSLDVYELRGFLCNNQSVALSR